MKIETNYPLCIDSLDYTNPIGAVNDDNCNPLYVSELESFFGKKISYLELGCAGGSIIDYMVNQGHDAYGIDGTDHPLKIGRPAWLKHYNSRLFTCDLSKDFQVSDAPEFDVISSWEFMEHIEPDRLDFVLSKVHSLVSKNGIVVFGISTSVCDHHKSIFSEQTWKENILSRYFDVYDYPFNHRYREDYYGNHNSFFVMLKPKEIYV